MVIWLVTLYAYSNYNNIDSLHSNVLGIRKQELENDIHIVVKPVWISDVVVKNFFGVFRDSGNILYPSSKQWLDNLVCWKM